MQRPEHCVQKGTPQELMEQGYYNRAESVCTGYAHQKKKKGKAEKSGG